MTSKSEWFVSEEKDGSSNPSIYIEAPGYGTVASIGGGTLGQRRAHARLIAAAPDLLEFVESVAALEDGSGETIPQAMIREFARDAKTLLAKARGDQP